MKTEQDIWDLLRSIQKNSPMIQDEQRGWVDALLWVLK